MAHLKIETIYDSVIRWVSDRVQDFLKGSLDETFIRCICGSEMGDLKRSWIKLIWRKSYETYLEYPSSRREIRACLGHLRRI